MKSSLTGFFKRVVEALQIGLSDRCAAFLYVLPRAEALEVLLMKAILHHLLYVYIYVLCMLLAYKVYIRSCRILIINSSSSINRTRDRTAKSATARANGENQVLGFGTFQGHRPGSSCCQTPKFGTRETRKKEQVYAALEMCCLKLGCSTCNSYGYNKRDVVGWQWQQS